MESALRIYVLFPRSGVGNGYPFQSACNCVGCCVLPFTRILRLLLLLAAEVRNAFKALQSGVGFPQLGADDHWGSGNQLRKVVNNGNNNMQVRSEGQIFVNFTYLTTKTNGKL
jgi:hypothetical protein